MSLIYHLLLGFILIDDLIIDRFYHFVEIKIMAMNTVSNLSDAGRTFAIDVAGSPNQAMMRTSVYTLKVPFSSLSQTIHSIGTRGGKVVNVRMLSVTMPGLEDIPVASGILIPFKEEKVIGASPQPVAKTAEKPKAESRRSSSKSKKR